MNQEMSANVPEHCPGVESETAGKTSACKGCPNQGLCSSGEAKVEDLGPDIVKQKLANVKHKILVLSGKGGVGKSTLTAMLAYSIATDEETNVAILDLDICGPSMPRIMGLQNEVVHQSGSGWSTIYVEENLSVMSVGFLLDDPEAAVIFRGPRKNGLIKQFLCEVDWGNIDFMLVDTPPGTSDEHLSIVKYLSKAGVDGCVLVTTPQEVSLLDVRKEIDFCNKVGLKIIGVVENMSTFVCPKCKGSSVIFPPTTGGAEKMALDSNIPFLGRLPLDPFVGRCCDEGKNYITEYSASLTTKSYMDIADKIKAACIKTKESK